MGQEIDISCGIDVGKWSHHATAIDSRTGEIVASRKVDQSESDIRLLFEPLCQQGHLMLVVDQPGSMSVLLFALARDMDIDLGFITLRTMSQAIDMYGGDLKTDAHAAFIITEISVRLPKLIKKIDKKDDARLQLTTIMSYGRELTSEVVRTRNRIHDLLLSINPALERHFQGKKIQSEFCLFVLE